MLGQGDQSRAAGQALFIRPVQELLMLCTKLMVERGDLQAETFPPKYLNKP